MSFVENRSQSELSAILNILKYIVWDEIKEKHDRYIAILNTQTMRKHGPIILKKSIHCMNVTYFNVQD